MNLLRPAFSVLILLLLITGVAYPLLTTGLAQWWFPDAAKGSLIMQNGELRGSALIGQHFTRPDYFQGRPSATAETPYNALASSGSNLAASNPQLDEVVKQRIAALREANPQASPTVPVALVTASASGLDPHLPPDAAEWQVPLIAQARHLPEQEVRKLLAAHTRYPQPGFIGEPVVNVLTLNMALDALTTP
ncbi:potassium-transporting ATPase subunit KdpC [Erwinia sp. P6884]|uniref:potassium-transporting ATPase subunit KdpC n=1 Tax=Erwinia sp. P6884 TaxID=3141450 RepID=UPI00318EBBBC